MLPIKCSLLGLALAGILAGLAVHGYWKKFDSSSALPDKPGASPAVASIPPVVTQAPESVEVSSPTSALEPLPAFLEPAFLAASLAALENNGSDLTRPMPSKHLVRCESRDIAAEVMTWGRENGFEPRDAGIFRGHGGVEFFDVELRRTEVPDPARIQKEGRRIHGAVATVEGAEYATWVGEIVAAR